MFITFEGPDGSGKSTQIRLLHRALIEEGYEVVLTREPGGTSIGEQVREVLHDVRNTEMLPRAEILLYSASRAQLVGEVINPALDRGAIVLCDRYAESTMAYQGWGHGLNLEELRQITVFATGNLRPDLIVYLDVDVETGLNRKRDAHLSGNAEWNRMDQKERAFHERVRRGYLSMSSQERERWMIVDGKRDAGTIHEEIRQRVETLLSISQQEGNDEAYR